MKVEIYGVGGYDGFEFDSADMPTPRIGDSIRVYRCDLKYSRTFDVSRVTIDYTHKEIQVFLDRETEQ